MDKKPAAKSKNKILRLLPKAAQASVSFQNTPYSPKRDKRPDVISQKLKTNLSKGFSSPIFSMIPAETRLKSNIFETQEPTSPKISCMGQIKHKNKICEKMYVSLPKEFNTASYSQPEKITKTRSVGPAVELKKKPSGIKKIFGSGRKSDSSIDHGKPPLPDLTPSLGQMRKFATSRDTLANFDWRTAQIAPEDDHDLHSDEGRGYNDREGDAVIPFSASILVNGAEAVIGGLVLEPRKEINLWKRRTMAQPRPLQLNIVRAQLIK